MTCRIELSDVCIDFPVFSSKSRGLLNTILKYGRTEEQRIQTSGLHGITVRGLRHLTMTIREGDRVGLIGRNGAGKTTLLRVLSGIYEPTAGEVSIRGKVSSLTDIMLGMDGDASGYENIAMRGLFLGLNRRESKELVPDIEAFTELGEHLALPVRTYSSGMLLRLAFAISTSIRPDILIMDEMIGAGDFHFREKARERLNAMLESVKILAIASHDNKIITSFCNKAVLLDQGRVVYMGDTAEALDCYRKLEATANATSTV